MGATAVPALMALATQATVASGAVGTMVLAFNGVGDALDALNEYQLEPSVENFQAMQEEFAKLGPAGEDFVRTLDRVGEQLAVLQQDARAGMFPGMSEGLDKFLDRLPELRVIVSELSQGVGTLSADAGAALAGDDWQEFFDYLAADGQEILVETGRAMGNFIDGFAEMMVAFGPLTGEFSDGLLDMSRGFEAWADGLDGTSGFRDFSDYVRENGPAVLDMLGALTMMLVDIGKAAAPVGAVAVPALEAFAEAVSFVANTPFGPLLVTTAAITSLWARLIALQSLMGSGLLGMAFGRLSGNMKRAGRSAAIATPSFRTLGLMMGTAATSTATLTRNIQTGGVAVGQYGRRTDKARQSFVRYNQEALWARQRTREFTRSVAPAAAQAAALGLTMSGLSEDMGVSNTVMLGLMGSLAGPWGAAFGAAGGAVLDLREKYDDLSEAIEGTYSSEGTNNIELVKQDLEEAKALFEELEAREEDWFETFENGMRAITGNATNVDVMDEAQERIADLNDELDHLHADQKRRNEQEEFEKAQQDIQRFADAAKSAWDDLTDSLDDSEVAFSDWLDDVRVHTRAAEKWAENLQQAFTMGLSPQAAAQLADRGQAGALRLDQAVQGGPEAIDELDKVLTRLDAATSLADQIRGSIAAITEGHFGLADLELLRTQEGAIRDVRAAFDSLPTEAKTRLIMQGFPQTRKQIQTLVEELDLTEEERKALVTLRDNGFFKTLQGVNKALNILDGKVASPAVTVDTSSAMAKLTGVAAYINKLNGAKVQPPTPGSFAGFGQSADGGTVPRTGLPYADRWLYALADGEEVITDRRREASTFRPELKDINAGLSRAEVMDRMWARGLADGGTVGPLTPAVPAIPSPGGTMEHVIRVEVSGEMDLDRAKAQIVQVASDVSRAEMDHQERFLRDERRAP